MNVWEPLLIFFGILIVLYIIIPSFLYVCAKDFVRGWLKGYQEHKDGGFYGKKKRKQ